MTSNSRGFTLTEFLIAIVILMVGLLGLLQSINLAMNTNMENSLRSEAVMLADDLIMKERTKVFDAISTKTTNTLYQQNNGGVLKNYSVQKVVSQPTASSKEIVINVAWRQKNKRSTNSASTIVSIFPQ